MVSLQKIDHIGIAVADLEAAVTIYSKLGFVDVHQETVAEQKVRTATIEIGDSNLELLEPMAEDSPVGRFLASRGPGIHHLAIRVDNIEEKLQELMEVGIPLLDTKPRLGAGGARVAFLHPKGTLGTLIELVER